MAFGSLIKLKEVLSSVTHLTTEAYTDLLSVIPPGLTAKLRLVPDQSLPSKLAHLSSALSFLDCEPDMGFDYEAVSIEGISEECFLFDHDVIIKNLRNNMLTVIDCTSNPGLVESKLSKLRSIISSYKVAASIEVYVFTPKIFTMQVTRPNDFTDSNNVVFEMLDDLSLMGDFARKRFYKCCTSVYDKAVSTILNTDREELKERYKAWTTDKEIVDIAVLAAKEHDINDSERFETIAKNSGAGLYYATFEKILSQQRPTREPFLVAHSDVNAHKETIKVLEELSINPICKVLIAAMSTISGWCAIDEHDELLYDVTFSQKANKTGILPISSHLKVVVKRHKGHAFWIYFREDIVDRNFLEQICNLPKIRENTKLFSGDVHKCHAELCSEYKNLYGQLVSSIVNPLKNSIFGKIETLSEIYMRDHDDVTGTASSILYHMAKKLNSAMVGAMVNHQYEVAKTFSASLKVSPRSNLYYVGVNGAFSSITIVRMSSTLDSFSTGSFFVIYKCGVKKSLDCARPFYKENDNIIQTKTRTLNRNTLAHYLKLPYNMLSLITWEVEHAQTKTRTLDGIIVNQIIVNSALHLAVNNDQFAQAAEQIRYLFTSNIGLGADPQAICSKINFIRPSTVWELLYIFRMLKLACSLNVVYKNKRIGELMINNEFGVAFPNSVKVGTSFSHLISSMYYANLYNKFRAFPEVSEAICYNGLDDEEDIYRTAILANKEFVHGIKTTSISKIKDRSFINSDDIINDEVEFCRELMISGAGRFQFSLMFIIGATVKNVNSEAIDISVLYQKLGESPIEACTMRGGMEHGPATGKPQGIRAASVMLEELIDEYGHSVEEINKNKLKAALLLDDLNKNDFDFSILSAVLRQFKNVGDYRYRIVQKDQKGHREISVLNAKFRLGALFSEKIAHELSSLVKCDVLDDRSKDSILESSVRRILKDSAVSLAISDNSDQKRWGPNHLLHSFSAMYFALLDKDMGLFRTVNLVLQYAENKRAKFPEKLLNLITDKKTASGSEPINSFMLRNSELVENGKFDKIFEWGMCQGIFHRTSSLYHGIMCYAVEAVLRNNVDIPKFEINSFVTSDDAERLIIFKGTIEDRVSLCRKVHSAIINVGSQMNILRNESKSVFSAHITEFNSVFYHKGFLATPTLKQRISKLDIGEGSDHINDYLTALSLPMGYLLNGGSYAGSVIMSILNVVMHTEQWRRWSIIEQGKFNRPVEFGGFPAIEPFGTMISGPIVNCFSRALPFCDIRSYAEFLSETSLTPALEVNLGEFSRTGFSSSMIGDIFVLKTANPIGIISMSRTDKRLSQFEKRHHMTEWILHDSSITLNSSDSSAQKFIFNLSKITKTCKFEANTGTNSFYIRFSDPWVNADRACMKYNPHSIYVSHFLENVSSQYVSYNDFLSQALSASHDEMRSFFRKCRDIRISKKHGENMVNKIYSVLEDATTVRDALAKTFEVKLQSVTNKNSIVRVNLSSGMSMDTDIFYHTLLKNIVGKRVEKALIVKTRNLSIWDSLETLDLEFKREAIEGIYFCDNVIMAHNKFMRSSTKLICPGELKPATLPELLNTYLNSKFTEQYGIAHSRFPDLNSSKFHMVAFKDCNTEIIARSKAYIKMKESNIDTMRRIPLSKCGIASDSTVITDYDTFRIDENCLESKIVQINTKNKYGFMQRGKMWIGANVRFMLTAPTIKALLHSDLTHYHEYAVHTGLYIKNQTKLSVDVTISGETCFEIQETLVEGDSSYYRHHFFTTAKSFYVVANAKLSETRSAKDWSGRVSKFINDVKRFRTNEEYEIPSESRRGTPTDSVTFHVINDDDIFDLVDFPNNLTIFLKHVNSGVLFPVCSVQDHDVNDINLGLNYKYNDFEEAMYAFKFFYDYLLDDDPVPSQVQEYLRMLLFRTSAFTPISVLNKLAERREINVRLSTIESADFLRALLMCNLVREMKSDRSRMQHYFLNLFRSSPYYNNGITSVKFDEKLLRDENPSAGMDIGTDDGPVDLSIPDVPAWIEKDREFNDLLSQPIIPETSSAPINDEDIIPDIAEFYEVDFDNDDDEDFEFALPITKPNIILGRLEPNEGLEDEYAKKLFPDEGVSRFKNPQIEAGVETVDVAIISRLIEDCPSLIRLLKSKAKAVKINKPRSGLIGNTETLYSCIQIYSNKVVDNMENAKTVFDRSFGKEAEMFKLKLPISAICLAEMNY